MTVKRALRRNWPIIVGIGALGLLARGPTATVLRVRDPGTGITSVTKRHLDGSVETWRERDDGTTIEGTYQRTERIK